MAEITKMQKRGLEPPSFSLIPTSMVSIFIVNAPLP
jgi:hypothetical protein